MKPALDGCNVFCPLYAGIFAFSPERVVTSQGRPGNVREIVPLSENFREIWEEYIFGKNLK